MKAKLLAIMAVLAMAFAGVAVLAVDDGVDAAPEAISASDIKISPEAIAIYDRVDATAANSATVQVKATIAAAAGAEGAAVTLDITGDATVKFSGASLVIEIAEGETVGYGQFTVEAASVATEIGVVNAVFSVADHTATSVKADGTVAITTYAAHAEADILAYAVNDTSAPGTKKVQAIWYADATALVDLSALDLNKTSHVKVKIGATGPEFIVAAQKQIWIDAAGIYDLTTITNNTITITSDEDATINYALTTAAYALKLESNDANSKYIDDSVEITLPYDNTGVTVDLGLAEILKKDYVFTADGNGENEKITAMTPTLPGYKFVGYAFADNAEPKDAIALDFVGKTIEDFIFAYGMGDDTNKIYAVYETAVYNIYLAADKTTATDMKFVSNAAYTANAAAFPELDQTLALFTKDVATGSLFMIQAPSVAATSDIVLVRTSQVQDLAAANTAYTYKLHVYSIDAEKTDGLYTKIDLKADITANYSMKMLASGIWTVTGIDQDVFILVEALPSTIVTGYELQMESVKNNAGVGTAVATFTKADVELADDATLSMAGTYFITDDSGRKVYGDLSTLSDGQVSYTAKKDFVNDVPAFDVAEGKLKLDDSAVDFALTMNGTAGSVGFYAIKAVFTITSTTTVETPYALGEVSA